MDPFALFLILLVAILLALNIAAHVRSRAKASKSEGLIRQSLVRLDARLDEQGRRQSEEASALRSGIDGHLSRGFEHAERTRGDIVTRLALIDRAREKIAELTSEVVSLREILADRSARGAFGEVQLRALVANVLPPSGFRMQHVLSNRRRADCMLFLPPPTGSIAIDSKFPLSNYKRRLDTALPQSERERAGKDFARDVRKHVDAVASKYIVPGETCDSAVLFIPAESVFAEIHAAHPELVEYAQRKNVWLTSPTTLWAVLTTARSVLKDAAARREAHAIQGHLRSLGRDFQQFEEHMGKLARHVRLAAEDVQRAQAAARDITGRFREIDQLDLGPASELPEACGDEQETRSASDGPRQPQPPT